ncbi:hypothetical protein GTP23_07265 [Pseudoduganella sp. FT93W]|uniref:Porin n=1 Tax=Duganella fentianensis TaxID=2692177 RepID=A0A845HZG3_9BURK|nr:hypothetical protein [Duganella fentianensis]MYN44871.1 hypothetical protein [Duganella fentianensis]
MAFAHLFLRRSRALLLLLSVLAAAGARADDATPGAVRISGFGTLGYVHSNEDQADYSASALNPGTAGASKVWSPDVDSRLGVQADWLLSPHWSVVVQLVAERSLQNGYAPQLEWAYLKYQLSPELNLRLGRIALPLLLVGDYRKAGYALPWVRPPVELYGAIPISNSDGVDANYRWASGEMTHITQLFYGHADVPFKPQAHARAQAMTGLSHIATLGALSVRLSAMTTRVSANLVPELFEGLQHAGTAGAALEARYALDNARTGTVALGFSYDSCAWFLTGEAASMTSHSFLGHRNAAYLSGGLRFGDWTPYLAYAVARPVSPIADAGLPLAGLDGAQLARSSALNNGLNDLLSSIPHQHSVTAGVRWDLASNYVLKMQYERLMPVSGTRGTLIHIQPGFRAGHAISVFSAALDFVF